MACGAYRMISATTVSQKDKAFSPISIRVHRGAAVTILNDDDPVVKRYANFFEPLDATARRDTAVLDATARPGVRRGRK